MLAMALEVKVLVPQTYVMAAVPAAHIVERGA